MAMRLLQFAALTSLLEFGRSLEPLPNLVVPPDVHVRTCRTDRVSLSRGGKAVWKVHPNCDASTNISFFDQTINGSRCRNEIERLWTLVDGCGNRINGRQIIFAHQDADTYVAPANVTLTDEGQSRNLTISGRPKLIRYCGDTKKIMYQDEHNFAGGDNVIKRIWTIETHCGDRPIILEHFLTIPIDRCRPNQCPTASRCESIVSGYRCRCVDCDREESLIYNCSRKAEGNYACGRCRNEYYSCDYANRVIKRKCPQALAYLENENRCEYARAAGCSEVEPCLTKTTSTAASVPKNRAIGNRFTCRGKAVGDYWCGRCSNNYWTCAVGGHAYKRLCHPSDLVYKEEGNMCVWPSEMGCDVALPCLNEAN